MVGALKVVVAVPLSCTEMEDGEKTRELIVADVHGSVTVIVNTVFSESVDGVNVEDPAGPLLAIVMVFETLT